MPQEESRRFQAASPRRLGRYVCLVLAPVCEGHPRSICWGQAGDDAESCDVMGCRISALVYTVSVRFGSEVRVCMTPLAEVTEGTGQIGRCCKARRLDGES